MTSTQSGEIGLSTRGPCRTYYGHSADGVTSIGVKMAPARYLTVPTQTPASSIPAAFLSTIIASSAVT
jgi:hypothetical protein